MAWFNPNRACGCCDCRIDLCKPCESIFEPPVHGIVVVELEWFVDALYLYPNWDCNNAYGKVDGFIDGTFSGPATRTCGSGLVIFATVDGYPPGKVYSGFPGDPFVEDPLLYHGFQIEIGHIFLLRTRVFGGPQAEDVVYGEAGQCDMMADLYPAGGGEYRPEGQGCSSPSPIGQARWRFECG